MPEKRAIREGGSLVRGGARKKRKQKVENLELLPPNGKNSGLLTGNAVDITNKGDPNQPLESNSTWIKVYSRKSKKAGKGKRKHHNCSNWNLQDTGFCNNKSSGVKSEQTGFGRKGNNSMSFSNALAVDGKQDGYLKEKTQTDPASKVSTDTNSNFHKLKAINSKTHEKTKWRRRKKNRKRIISSYGKLISITEKEVNGSAKSENIDSGEKINLHPEALSKIELGENSQTRSAEEKNYLQGRSTVDAENIFSGEKINLHPEILSKFEMGESSQTRPAEEKDDGQGRATSDAANKSDQPHLAECNLKTSVHYMRMRKSKKNKTLVCSNLTSMSEKEVNASMKSKIVNSVNKNDLYPEICSNSAMRNAKPNSEKAYARKRHGGKKETHIANKDNAIDNLQLLCYVSSKLLEPNGEDLDQLQKNEMPIEDKSDCKDEKRSSSSSVKNVTDDVTLDATIRLNDISDNLPTPLQRVSICCAKKKLLVLDLNGLLVDVTYEHHSFQRAPVKVAGKSVFKRPFCDEFLDFCFERFDIGIWSSRKKENMDAVVNFLFGEKRSQLMFCWSQSKCTTTGFTTLGNAYKPLVLKELKKLWNNEDQDLQWEKGDYSPSNTLLIDDSPYKALCNPPHTAIFPNPYSYRDQNDNSLGLEGDLRVYLEGLAQADNVQSYVEEHPFGQQAIMPGDPSWKFYLQIIEKMNPSFTQPAVADGV